MRFPTGHQLVAVVRQLDFAISKATAIFMYIRMMTEYYYNHSGIRLYSSIGVYGLDKR
jgi:hypothetical protein